ncbi:type VI secretion system baseplate subunit TssG [Rhodocaloribacter litoris]|uniref:type VI secretion system baseplate subunit TssG n=1 Tax=Rhodocaloribacter litoris TaxID=2558931 RepID=UPI00141EF284|nr:type VI secretion system baseplate subunit TssG [Rhodocaloribacter litoris]QXD13876.1 type VI secretion system baseplate subunit TssG [Rhodocaloribacter litoris]
MTDEAGRGEPRADGSTSAFPPQEGVYGRLFREGYAFDFYQAVRLLERYFADAPGPGETAELRRERIFFRPDVAIVFPPTDVRRIEARRREPCADVVLTFMGLYGIGSPLPVYFYDELASEDRETLPLRDFLDIFNHRLYAYFYRAWKKYRPVVRRREGTRTPEDDPHLRRFLCVAGLGTRGALDRFPLASPMRLAAFAGLLSPQVRHAEGLQKLLSAMLETVPVRIEENVLRWVRIPRRGRLGRGDGGLRLGKDATLGERVPDASGLFRVVLGPLRFDDFQAYLPGASRARLVDDLVRLYAPDYLDYDVELRLDTTTIPPVRLGSRDVRLGQTTWLGKPKTPTLAHRVRYAPAA